MSDLIILRFQELQAIQAGEPARARYASSQGNESAGLLRQHGGGRVGECEESECLRHSQQMLPAER